MNALPCWGEIILGLAVDDKNNFIPATAFYRSNPDKSSRSRYRRRDGTR